MKISIQLKTFKKKQILKLKTKNQALSHVAEIVQMDNSSTLTFHIPFIVLCIDFCNS